MFSGTGKWTWLWLVVRVYIGWQWVEAGWHKLSDPKWMETGLALKGFWEKAVAIPEPPARALITHDWYRSFLEFLLHGEHYTWFAKFVAVEGIVCWNRVDPRRYRGSCGVFQSAHEF